MKKILIIVVMIFAGLSIQAQSPFKVIKMHYLAKTNFWIRGGVLAISGAGDGTAEALRYHYASFKRVFPNCSDQYWDPSKSWTNKKICKVPGITDGFANDGFHWMRNIRFTGMVVGISIPLGNKDKKKWYEYGFEIVSSGLFYGAGFSSTYDGLFRNR
jgi:hypothetical protein